MHPYHAGLKNFLGGQGNCIMLQPAVTRQKYGNDYLPIGGTAYIHMHLPFIKQYSNIFDCSDGYSDRFRSYIATCIQEVVSDICPDGWSATGSMNQLICKGYTPSFPKKIKMTYTMPRVSNKKWMKGIYR